MCSTKPVHACRGLWQRQVREILGRFSEIHQHKCQDCHQVCAAAMATHPECTCQSLEGDPLTALFAVDAFATLRKGDVSALAAAAAAAAAHHASNVMTGA